MVHYSTTMFIIIIAALPRGLQNNLYLTTSREVAIMGTLTITAMFILPYGLGLIRYNYNDYTPLKERLCGLFYLRTGIQKE